MRVTIGDGQCTWKGGGVKGKHLTGFWQGGGVKGKHVTVFWQQDTDTYIENT